MMKANGITRRQSTEDVCWAAGEAVRYLAIEMGNGTLRERDFVRALLELEERSRKYGLQVCASHTLDEWIVVTIKARGEKHACQWLEFCPATGKFRDSRAPYGGMIAA